MIAFIRANARWIAGGFLLTFCSSFGQTFFIGLSGEELRAKFALSDGQFGVIYMIATLGSALTLPWLGRLLDVMRGRAVAGLVMPALACACVAIAFAPNIVVLVLAIYALRLFGQGMLTNTAFTEIGRWFAVHRGRAVSLVTPGHQAGEALLPVTFTAIAAAFGWQYAWLGGAALLVVLALPLLWRLWAVERMPQATLDGAGADRTARDWTRGEVLRDPWFYALLVGVLAPPFIGTTVFFHQDYLVELRGYDLLVFASAFPVMAGTTIVFALICGRLIDAFGAVRLAPFFLIPLTLASAAAGMLEASWGVYVFFVLLGVSYGFTSTLVGALWPEVYGVAHLGAVRSAAVAAMVFSTALGPGITGALIDAGVRLQTQLLVMSGWCLCACFVLGAASKAIAARNAGV